MSGRSVVQRFRAKIQRQGPNPCVDVPGRVTRAFASLTRAGRIQVEGTLNGASIRTTLIPVGRGGHRLFVNGGMRSAARVSVGDTLSFELRAVEPDLVHPPRDVAAGLRKVDGALGRFDALRPSHRRELLRYIDDARTAEARERRIQKTIDHLLGRVASGLLATSARARSAILSRSLWTCPHCGNEFVNRNQYHSCRRYELAEAFRGKPDPVRALFDRFRELVEACGPVKVIPYRDKISFMVRVRFAGAIPRTRWLDIVFWLPRRIGCPAPPPGRDDRSERPRPPVADRRAGATRC